jgi:glucokinase-like ROK family protein
MTPARIADQELVRNINRSIVLNKVRLNSTISRAEIANLTGLNRSTVSNIVGSLIDDGLVWETELQDSTGGRPGISLSLNPDGGAVIGVEIGVDFLAVMLTDFVAEVRANTRIDIEPHQSQIEILGKAEVLIEQALTTAREQHLQPLGIGVGVPGLVNVRQGELVFAPNLNWKGVPIRLMWNQRFRLPVYVDNEANLSALGEYYFGIARGVENFVLLKTGVGLGGGIILGGKLFRGWHGFAGEIGHVMRDPNGEICGCGRVGCWETQVSPRAIVNRVRKMLLETPASKLSAECRGKLSDLTFGEVIQFARQGYQPCQTAIEEVGVHLAHGMADLINIFNPEMVVIGGEFAEWQDLLAPIIEKVVRSEALYPAAHELRIGFSEHGNLECVYGAVAIVLDDILRENLIL